MKVVILFKNFNSTEEKEDYIVKEFSFSGKKELDKFCEKHIKDNSLNKIIGIWEIEK